ncbi:MAG TPA: hypothetical protein VEQ65_01725 [Opitutus sp.]|nr:hypothetical protein [Opitutus sp.]
MSAFTLQINLSPGDSAYADQTVPALLAAHPDATERLLIVDVCKPQRTRIVDPAVRFPEPGYAERSTRIVALAEGLLARGAVDRVVTLRPGAPIFPVLSRRYLRPWVRETHDYGGCALMAYLAAFELCRTRWLLHYDADMLLHQKPGYNWVRPAQSASSSHPGIIAVTPRIAPPSLAASDTPSANEQLASRQVPEGWVNPWLSTRCFLVDLDRLRPLLPLLQGRVLYETLAAKALRRGYPRSPEAMLFRRMSAARRDRLVMRDSSAWLLHPTRKNELFLRLLPGLLAEVQQGRCPPAQRGHQDLLLEAWQQSFASP